jgi:hypothetical protein
MMIGTTAKRFFQRATVYLDCGASINNGIHFACGTLAPNQDAIQSFFLGLNHAGLWESRKAVVIDDEAKPRHSNDPELEVVVCRTFVLAGAAMMFAAFDHPKRTLNRPRATAIAEWLERNYGARGEDKAA